jgi:hypothetical protein
MKEAANRGGLSTYFVAGSLIGTWIEVLLMRTPSEGWPFLSRTSKSKMNFSASMMHLAQNSWSAENPITNRNSLQ